MDVPLKIAVNRAWTIYLPTRRDVDLPTRRDVDEADQRRCTLERYLNEKWRSGENDPETLPYLGS